jgi:hypothetical protein
LEIKTYIPVSMINTTESLPDSSDTCSSQRPLSIAGWELQHGKKSQAPTLGRSSLTWEHGKNIKLKRGNTTFTETIT